MEKIPDQLKTCNGRIIDITDEAKEHLLAHPDAVEFLEEAALKLEISDGVVRIEKAVRFDRIIGISTLVKVEPVLANQKTFFAKRIAREFPSHVALGRKGEPCDSMTLKIEYDKKENKYFLCTAYIGYPCPHEPFNIQDKESDEFKEALDFWCNHALVYDLSSMSEVFKTSWAEVLQFSKEG